MKRHIPNILTLLNLFSGTIACILALKGMLIEASFFVFLGVFFDFFDGFAARLLNVQGELGKQLDSLADAVTSGVAPAFVMYELLKNTASVSRIFTYGGEQWQLLPFIGLLLALAAAYRLANFNIDTRQTDSFIGLPTPAMALVVLSFPLIQKYGQFEWMHHWIQNQWFLIAVVFLLSYIMNAEIRLFALKFKNFTWKDNKFRFVFLGVSIALLLLLQVTAIPIIILFYVVLSVILQKVNS